MRPLRPARLLPRRRQVAPASAQVARQSDGTALVVSYGAAAFVLVAVWALGHGSRVSVSPLELCALVALAACSGQISVLVGPRTWYSPTAPVVLLAGLTGGPLAGALAGLATEALGSDRVWRQRAMGAARTSIEGFVAGLAGLLPLAGEYGTSARAAAAALSCLILSQAARGLVVHVRGIRPAGVALRTGALVDLGEAVIMLPILATLLTASATSPVASIGALGALLVSLALAERAHSRQAAQLERERTVARTDALTLAPNRLALDEAILLEHGRILRGAYPAGLFIVDLDNFKLANDMHGHDVGDALLVAAVERLRGGLRATDLVGRWGGDELIVLARDIGGPEEIEAHGQRIRALIGDTPFTVGRDSTLLLTASVGGTILDGSTPPAVVLKRADVAVYRAKHSRDASAVEIPAESRVSPARLQAAQLR